MKKFFVKLFFGENICKEILKESSITRRVKNLKIIWKGDDYGIERLVRLFLAISQFLFLGTYIRQIFGKTSIKRDFSIDIFVILKVIFSLLLLKYHLYNILIFKIILIWFFFETLLYIPTLIFASDYLSRPRSYKRSMILFFLNYIQITFDFACFYSMKRECMSKSFDHWYDAIYFSFVTGSTTGYGDFYPITLFGKCMVTTQTKICLIFIALFLNIFSNKMEGNGYFNNK